MGEMGSILQTIMGPAAALQSMTIQSEQEKLDQGADYSKQHVRQATVHTRQDMILLVYYLASIERLSKRISIALLVLILIVGTELVLALG